MYRSLEPYQKEAVIEFENKTQNIEPLVSIIVLTYNHQKYIEQCLDALLEQQVNFDIEILLGEDDSTDKTRAICLKYAKAFPNKIRLFLHSRANNIKVDGVPTGRFNYLYSLYTSRGKYVAICEGDDYWLDPFKLQKQVDFLEANSNYSFCWTRFKTLDQKTQEFTLDFNTKYFPNDEAVVDFDFEKSFKGWHIGNLTLVYRKSFFNIETHQKFKYFRDVHLIAQLLKKGKGACLNFVGAVYRKHDGGIHNTVSEYNGYRIGYACNKEIYMDNRSEPFVKKKYMLAFQNFINVNVRHGHLFKAFKMSLRLFFIQWSILALLRNFKRILVKGLKL